MKSTVTVIPRIKSAALKVPTFGVIDNDISIWELLPILFCKRKYMYESAVIKSFLSDDIGPGRRLSDIVRNASLKRKMIKDIILADTEVPEQFIEDLFERTSVFLDANECLKMGIIDEVVPILDIPFSISHPIRNVKKMINI